MNQEICLKIPKKTDPNQVDELKKIANEMNKNQNNDTKRTKYQDEKKIELKLKIIGELEKLKGENGSDKRISIWNKRIDYPLLSQLLIGIKIMFPTSVECETTFSFMNVVKSPSRNQLGDATLDDILRIKYTNKEVLIK